MISLKNTYTLLSAVILAAITGLVVMCIRYNTAFTETSERVLHTASVLKETQNAGAGLRDLEKGLGKKRLIFHIETLRRQTSDNPGQQRRIDSLEIYTGLIPAGSPAIRSNYAGQGAYYPDSIRETLLRIMNTEQILMAEREAANKESRQLLSNSIIGLLLLIFTLLCVSAVLIIFHLERRRKAEEQLNQSERRFSLLIQKEKYHAIFLLDPNGRIMTWNEGARRIKGYTEQEVLGQPIAIFYTQQDLEADEPGHNLRMAAEGGEHENAGWRKRKDGSLFWADVTITALYDGKGVVTGFIKITRDLSAQRLAEDEIKASLSQQKELNEMKSRFVALASHEFKTPLSVILSSISLVEKYESPEMVSQRRRHIDRIRSNINSLRLLLNDFLSIEKLESGGVSSNATATDVTRLTADCMADLEPTCKPGQRMLLEINGERSAMMVDAQLLRNVLNNLLSNAIKYSAENTTVRCIIDFEPDKVDFSIIDQGIGIPVEEQKHLFERFFRAGNTSGISGTGLGLSIVKKYLDLMHGSICLSSIPGEGSTFTITIPLSSDGAENNPAHVPGNDGNARHHANSN